MFVDIKFMFIFLLKAILKVYKQYWSEVEYNPISGLCVCSKPKVKN